MNEYSLHQQILSAEEVSLRPPREIDFCDDCRRGVDDCRCAICSECDMKIESLDVDQECDCEEADKRRAKRLGMQDIEPYKRDLEDA